MAEQWQQKDTLRQMTSKFNTAVTELEDLKESSTQVNQATEQKFTEMQQSMTEQFTQVNKELDQKISDVTAEDIGLGEVDNTPDLQKPVSELQQQAINTAKTEAMAEMLTSEEEQLTTPVGDEPSVSPMVEALIREIVQEIGAQSGVTSYGIASKLVLGVVKASDDIDVDSETGRMTVAGYSLLKEKVKSLVTGLGTLEQLSTTTKTDLVSAVNELFQSVSDGKGLLSSAITDRGVATEATATFQQMATNIRNLDLIEQKYLCHIPVESYTNNLANMPYPFQDGQAVMYKGELHILGGIVNGVSYGTNHYKWNGTAWTQVSVIPKEFYAGKAAVVQNPKGEEEIHIFGGTSTDYRNHYKWDGVNWTSVGALPSDFEKIVGVGVVSTQSYDVIHIFSGTTHYLMRYGIAWIEWVKLESFPYNLTRESSAVTVLDNQIYVAHGYSSSVTHILVLSGSDMTICNKVFTPVKYADYSDKASAILTDLKIYYTYPHMIALEKLKGLILFSGQYDSAFGRTFVRGVRIGLEENVFNTLYGYPSTTGYNSGEFTIDESKQKMYIIGGSSQASTTYSFIDINYEIFAKISNK